MKSSELAQRIGAVCEGGDVEVTEVASFAAATARSLIFVEQARFLPAALDSLAAAIIVPAETAPVSGVADRVADNAENGSTNNAANGAANGPTNGFTGSTNYPANRSGKVLLRAHNPRLAFARAAEELRRSEGVADNVADNAADNAAGQLAVGADPSHSNQPRVHSSAIVDPAAEVHPTAWVEALALVGPRARIGARTRLGPGSIVGPGVVIGEDCHLVARVVVYTGTTMGDRVIVKAGAVLGSDGFGFVPDPATGRYHKFPQIGRLEIGNDVEIGANTTIDRGALDATVIGDGVKIDNLVQVGHNVHIGSNVVIAAQTGVSGSTVLEDNVIVGGQVGIGDHARIGQGVILGSQCGILSKKVLRGKGILFWGTPARPLAEYLKELATLARLTRKKK